MASQQARVRVILILAFMMSVLIHGVLVTILPQSAGPSPAGVSANAHSVAYTIAGAALMTSLFWTITKLSAATTPARFLSDLILALALAEVASISGLILAIIGQKPADFWPLGIAALLVQGLFILPRALKRG